MSLFDAFRQSQPLEEARPYGEGVHQLMQDSLSAYFNVHGLNKDRALPKGLTISWGKAETAFHPNSEAGVCGYLVATGEQSKEKGWPVFNAIKVERSCNRGALVAIKP